MRLNDHVLGLIPEPPQKGCHIAHAVESVRHAEPPIEVERAAYSLVREEHRQQSTNVLASEPEPEECLPRQIAQHQRYHVIR